MTDTPSLYEHFEIGQYNILRVDRETPHGYFLHNGREESVLLPYALCSDRFERNTLIKVFLFADSQDRLIATRQKPFIILNEIGYLKVVGLSKFGIFCDIGLDKELLIPKKLQPKTYAIGEYLLVKMLKDPFENRLIGDTKIGAHLSDPVGELSTFQRVSLLPFKKTDLGYKVIINHTYEGLLFHNELFRTVILGEMVEGYIKEVRRDGKVTVTLNAPKAQQCASDKEQILAQLTHHHGMLPVHSKSSPQEIQTLFSMSKKAFKRALNELIEEKKITLNDGKIYLGRS